MATIMDMLNGARIVAEREGREVYADGSNAEETLYRSITGKYILSKTTRTSCNYTRLSNNKLVDWLESDGVNPDWYKILRYQGCPTVVKQEVK